MSNTTNFWVGYKLQKDGSPICDGFNTQADQDKRHKELEGWGYKPLRLNEEGSRRFLMGESIRMIDLTNTI